MDTDMSRNDFTKTCRACKNCAFQNQSHWFKAKCKIYIFCKPRQIFENGDCEFFVKQNEEENQ